MTEENIEVKVAKLETKVDTIIETVAQINNKFDSLSEDRVTRRELEEFKKEVKHSQTVRTLLSTILTFVITSLTAYVLADILGK